MRALAAVAAAVACWAASAQAAGPVASWRTATATAYASFEHLTGCRAPGICSMACGGYLNDKAFTVASNPRLGLRCGQRIMVCRTGSNPELCRTATVTDRTASRFDFEFSYALAVATGMPRGAGWDAPRFVVWRTAR